MKPTPNLALIADILQKLADRRESGDPPEKLEVIDSARTKKHSAWGGELGYRIFYPKDYWNKECNKATTQLLNDMNIWSSYPESVMRTITENKSGAIYTSRVPHIYAYIITDNEGTPVIPVDMAPLTKSFPKLTLTPAPATKLSVQAEPFVDAYFNNTYTINSEPCHCRKAAGFTSGWCGVAGGGVPGCDH